MRVKNSKLNEANQKIIESKSNDIDQTMTELLRNTEKNYPELSKLGIT